MRKGSPIWQVGIVARTIDSQRPYDVPVFEKHCGHQRKATHES